MKFQSKLAGKDKTRIQGFIAHLGNANENEAINSLRFIRSFTTERAMTMGEVFEQGLCFAGEGVTEQVEALQADLKRVTDERDDFERQFNALDKAYGMMVNEVTNLRRQSAGDVDEVRQQLAGQINEIEQKAAIERERWAAAYGQVGHKLTAPNLNCMYFRLLIAGGFGGWILSQLHTVHQYPMKSSFIWSLVPDVIVLIDFFVRKYLHEGRENEVIESFIEHASIMSQNWEDRK